MSVFHYLLENTQTYAYIYTWICIYSHIYDTESSECAKAIFTDYYSTNDIFKAFYFSKLNEFPNPSKISLSWTFCNKQLCPFPSFIMEMKVKKMRLFSKYRCNSSSRNIHWLLSATHIIINVLFWKNSNGFRKIFYKNRPLIKANKLFILN